jgi:hypothetical protein
METGAYLCTKANTENRSQRASRNSIIPHGIEGVGDGGRGLPSELRQKMIAKQKEA